MNIEIEKRVLDLGEKFVLQKDFNPTVRSIAKQEKMSKSTVHKDMTERLKECNMELYYEVRKILEKNKEERHIRGGEATKQKCLTKVKKCNLPI